MFRVCVGGASQVGRSAKQPCCLLLCPQKSSFPDALLWVGTTVPLWNERCSLLSNSRNVFNIQKKTPYAANIRVTELSLVTVVFLLLPPPFAEHQDLEDKLSRYFVIDLSGGKRSPRAFHSLLGCLKRSVCELELLRLLLGLRFSAPRVVCGFCRGHSCALFPIFGWVFLCLYFTQERGWLIFYQGKDQDCRSSPILPEDRCFCKVPDPDYSIFFSIFTIFFLFLLFLTSFLECILLSKQVAYRVTFPL